MNTNTKNVGTVVKPAPQRTAAAPKQPDPLWLRLLNAILQRPNGITRTGIRKVVGHHVPASRIEADLAWFKGNGLAHFLLVKPSVFQGRWNGRRSAGRPAEVWFAKRVFLYPQ